jgi:hypothetical protein
MKGIETRAGFVALVSDMLGPIMLGSIGARTPGSSGMDELIRLRLRFVAQNVTGAMHNCCQTVAGRHFGEAGRSNRLEPFAIARSHRSLPGRGVPTISSFAQSDRFINDEVKPCV